ncbi:hypothetical protein J8F10_08390 [Gemmata sp. G18]|uniref:Type II toxin-antitoxin system PemK/MazF family toxin n=1 Tax=Gemmata palustris TaxID=2822762 RepID=A0ABS5BNJ1_9BACT|nr:hypothetical protein [Gemmata palustris]MBP3955297.1 hypothetical protein [Gemmata palustris]
MSTRYNRWPACCRRDMVLYLEAERPEPNATQVTAPVLLLTDDQPTGTTILSFPKDRTRTG